MTVAIAFTGGTYGTYMDWCLSTLTSTQDIVSPFTASGSSHNHQGKQVLNIEGWNAYIRSGQQAAFVRLHPKVTKNQSLSRNLDQLCQQANRVIHMYPSKDTMLLCMNNAFSKTTDNWWKKNFSREIDPEKIYQNWSIAPGTDIDDIPRWVKREFLSFYMMPMWYDQIEWHHPTTWSNPNCIVVNVDELLYNFEFTINKVKEFCNLEFKKNIADLLPYHKENLQKQKYERFIEIIRMYE